MDTIESQPGEDNPWDTYLNGMYFSMKSRESKEEERQLHDRMTLTPWALQKYLAAPQINTLFRNN